MLVSDVIIEFFISKGTQRVFLLTGGAISFLIDRFHLHPEIDYICVAHEQAAAMAADGYSRMRPDSIGVALVTSGPGATNTLTGVGCSWFDSIPSMIISGQVNTYESRGDLEVRQIGFQEMDIVSIATPITKFAAQVTQAEDILFLLEKAYWIAKSGRPGPVLLDIPMDIQRQEVDYSKLKRFIPDDDSESYRLSCRERLEACLDMIDNAVRPVLLAGGGVRNSGGQEALVKVAEKYHLPVCVSTNGIDSFPHDHPNFAGFIGVYGNRGGNLTLTNSDLLIAVGSRLDNRQTGVKAERFARAARKIVVDIDANELNVRVKADQAICSDAKIFLETLADARQPGIPESRNTWLELVRTWKGKYQVISGDEAEITNRVDPYVVLKVLSDNMKPKDVVVLDTGQNMLWGMQTIGPRQGMRMWTAGGMSPMGYSLPAAMGAAVSETGGRVICVIGDGGMQINIQELETIRRYNLPVITFIMNNKSLGLIRQFQDDYLDSRYEASRSSSSYFRPDFPTIASGYGIPSSEITKSDQIQDAIKNALDADGPFVCNIHLLPTEDVKFKAVMGRPIEDQHPYLPREELFENLLIEFDRDDYEQ